jgi:hypothetical protein
VSEIVVRQMSDAERLAMGPSDLRGEQPSYVNMSGLDDALVAGKMREVASQISRWVEDTRGTNGRSSLFDRSAYQAPDNVYNQMKIARQAMANDDVVSGAAEVTEGLIFQGVKWESENPDDADIFNQISKTLDLDSYIRQAYRELFTCSQVITASWWGWKTYKVRGRSNPEELPLEKKVDPTTGVESYEEPRDEKTLRPKKRPKGVKRKKEYRVWAPVALTVLDSTKVVPVGNLMWGQERLAWQASKAEMDAFEQGSDPTMETLFLGRYVVPERSAEEKELLALGVDPKRLMELNPMYVWRHCVTKANYQRFPEVRLKSVFKLLDLKQQLMEADRVSLIGAANYILLVKKGTKEDPAYPEEIANLRENFDVVAKLPVIISDHRLEIEIIVPSQDYTLDKEKYDLLDARILSRLLGATSISSSGQRNENSLSIARGIARQLETKRHMLKRSLEHRIAHSVTEHPFNGGGDFATKKPLFEDEPNLAFTPRNVQLDNDNQIVQAVMALRTQKEISRESILEYFGFDQAVEAQRREFEEESGLDAVFGTQVPFDGQGGGGNAGGTPPPPPASVSGAQGGRPTGGGSPTKDATKARPRNRTPEKT